MGFKNRLRKMRGKLASETDSYGGGSPAISPRGETLLSPPTYAYETGAPQQQQQVNPAVMAVERNLRSDESSQSANDLASFDACVEACDALAASDSGRRDCPSPTSASRSGGGATTADTGTSTSTGGGEGEGGLTDCSVLVSPDGALLFLPQGFNVRPGSGDVATPSEKTASQSMVEQMFPGEEYESAVVMGSDLQPGGDRLANGFSARGWSPSAASIALRRSVDELRSTEAFLVDLVTSRMEAAALTADTCDKYRTAIMCGPDLSNTRPASGSKFHTPSFGRSSEHGASKSGGSLGRNKSSQSASSRDTNSMKSVDLNSSHNNDSDGATDRRGHSNSNGGFIDMLSMSSSFSKEGKLKSGPISFPGTTLHAAAVSLEQYYAVVAENDSHRWSSTSAKSDQAPDGTAGGLAAVHAAAEKTAERAARRESALHEAQQRAREAEAILTVQTADAARRWKAIEDAEAEVQRIFEERTRERSRERERRRRLEENERQAQAAAGQLESGVTQAELWELVAQIGSEETSFSPIDLPNAPMTSPTDQALSMDTHADASSPEGSFEDSDRPLSPPLPAIDRADIELQLNMPGLRASAMEADDNVEDAAAAFLNILSTLDTTRKSARVAAESALLSAANSQAKCLRAVLDLERASIEERLRHVEWLERQIDGIDVRADLDAFIEHDKRERPGGTTRLGDDDDGGIASALAVLNSHSEGRIHAASAAGTSGMSTYEGWGGGTEGDGHAISREEIEKAVECLFEDEERGKADNDSGKLDRNIQFLVDAVGKTSVRARTYRASACYALNNKRSIKREVATTEQFEGLCSVFNALLSGCDREASDVANAKMCMMLSQTFYMVDQEDVKQDIYNSGLADRWADRKKRIYVKSRLVRHPLFSDEDFWVQALYQCVTEALTGSGVMRNFEKSAESEHVKMKKKRPIKVKWYEFTPDERFEAASQVHAVIFAQLGALSHSMVEFGCDPDQACAFVRRLSIQHQLPLSQRTMLLQHLMERQRSSSVVEEKEEKGGFDQSLSSSEVETPSAAESADEEPSKTIQEIQPKNDSTDTEQSITTSRTNEEVSDGIETSAAIRSTEEEPIESNQDLTEISASEEEQVGNAATDSNQNSTSVETEASATNAEAVEEVVGGKSS